MTHFLIYQTPDGPGCCPDWNTSALDKEKSIHKQQFKIVKCFNAESYNKAMQVFYDYFGFGKYKAFTTIDDDYDDKSPDPNKFLLPYIRL